MAATTSRVLVYGGKGALGSSCVQYFKSKNWWVGSIDMVANEEANENIIVTPSDSWTSQEQQVNEKVDGVIGEAKIDLLICVAGGWAGGSADSKDFIKNSDLMWKQSVWTSAIAAQIASKHLKKGGVLALTGAQPALSGTAGMIGYGMAKAAVHQLVKSLAQDKGGLPEGAFVSAILPVTLDTPMNRKWMAKADKSTWTPLETVAELFMSWCEAPGQRPQNGSLVQLLTKDGDTKFVPA